MKHFLTYTLAALLLFVGCVQNVEPVKPLEKSQGLEISFGNINYDMVSIETRATLPTAVEDRVSNLYVLIFRQDGTRVYSQFYDVSTRMESAAFPANRSYCWYATKTAGNSTQTSGKIKINSADLPDEVDGTIYIITNLDNEVTSLSDSQLDVVGTQDELLFLMTQFLSESQSITRTGNFVMVGSGDITIHEGNLTHIQCYKNHSSSISLERIDAKVSVTFGVVPGAKVKVHATLPGGLQQEYYQMIESFEMESWQVFNLPNGSYVIPRPVDAPDDLTGGYFDSNVRSFESIKEGVPCQGYAEDDLQCTNPINTTREEYGFSFYMWENRQSSNKHKSVTSGEYSGISQYNLRDKRLRNADGTLMEGENKWEFAPENATYIVVKGVAKLKHIFITGEEDLEHSLLADVTYTIHLGDFGVSSDNSNVSRFDNYDINRNTHYTYNVNIRGINNIIVETEADSSESGYDELNEKQSGAKGLIFANPSLNNYTFDAHFGQRVFKVKYEDFIIFTNIDSLSWFVSSPFGRVGMPDRVGPNMVEIPNGLDYKWVHFAINRDENPQLNKPWPGRNSPQLMNILDFANYIRGEVKKRQLNQPSDFGLHGDDIIYVQVYVDEYYYDVDPISGEYRESLWREFVNQQMREMSLICIANQSADKTSAYTKGLITIRQRAIQTIYNPQTAMEGWGVEIVDEYRDRNMRFYNRSHRRSEEKNMNVSGIGTTSDLNGLYNSGKLWGLVSYSNTFVSGVPWSNFLDYSKADVGVSYTDFLKDEDEIVTMRYACLARNRDENANGVIDQDEIKWYMASLDQLRLLFIADQGLSGQAQLYYVPDPGDGTQHDGLDPTYNENYDKWRSHVVSSTMKNNQAQFVFAEQGSSFNTYGREYDWDERARYTMRCVRNLDRNPAAPRSITNQNDTPPHLITMTQNEDNTYTFDLTHINPQSLRPKVTTDLLPMDQYSLMARPYKKFTTGPLCDLNALSSYNDNGYIELQGMLSDGLSPCPEGYHTPNVREMTIAFMNIEYGNSANERNYFWPTSDVSHGLMVCNYWSFGATRAGGNGFNKKNPNQYITWYFCKGQSNITVDQNKGTFTTGLIRCMKDED